jgi:multimeric flavodoxin WrbA
MKIIAINGSPRKKWNTAILLEQALEGAGSQGAETELIHLYDLNFKGCISCFACKTKGGKSYGKCGMRDELTPVLERMNSVDAFILGSPIYFGAATGEMRCFMERLLFPNLAYSNPPRSLFGRKINTGFIYTMNVSEDRIRDFGGQHIDINRFALGMVFGACESLLSFETLQFEDYSKIVSDLFDVEERAKRRQEVFPQDCRTAFEMGARLASAKVVE